MSDINEPVAPVAATTIVRLASSPQEIEAAQKIRYQVFYEENNATPTDEIKRQKRDMDRYDDHADHLIVVDQSGPKEKVVGTYRLLTREAARKSGQFYSSGEYDMSVLIDSGSEILELGRSCVLPEFRSRPVLQLLWQGIADYVVEHNIDMLFGCGSMPGTDPQALALPLSYLYHYHLAPEGIRARALPERYVGMNMIAKDDIVAKAAFAELPPLIKGYLRTGATVGDGAVIDRDFNTTDVFIAMPTTLIEKRYRKHYERRIQKTIPGGAPETDAQEDETDTKPYVVVEGRA